MNILSHYYSGHRPGQPYYNFGLVFPDLLKIGPKSFKNGIDQEYPEEWLWQIKAGCERHLQDDSIFHSNPAFKSNVSYIRKEFEQSGIIIPGMRLFFVGHILYELVLDRIILLNEPLIAGSFYNDINSLDLNRIGDFITRFKLGSASDFSAFFERFRTSKYIYHYVNDDKLMYATNRIMQRAAQPVFPERYIAEFSGIIFNVQKHIFQQFISIFEALKVDSLIISRKP